MSKDRRDELAEASYPAPAPQADDHAGHRQRVRERFLKVGGDALEVDEGEIGLFDRVLIVLSLALNAFIAVWTWLW